MHAEKRNPDRLPHRLTFRTGDRSRNHVEAIETFPRRIRPPDVADLAGRVAALPENVRAELAAALKGGGKGGA